MEKDKLLPSLNRFIEETEENWNYILPPELNAQLKKDHNLFLLDVRRPEDFRKFHIAGSGNIFWMNLLEPQNLARLPKDKKIVLICYVGHSASQALVLLRLLGYDAVVLKYGMGHSSIQGIPMSGWLNFSFDVVTGEE